MSGGTYRLKLTSNEKKIFEKPFMAILFALRVFAAERKSPKKYVLYFVFMSLDRGSNSGFTCNKPTHYLLDYSDFFLSNF